jgi:WD40 repeat protein
MAPALESTRRELVAHRKAVLCLAWSASGRKLASGGADECARTWNVEASASAKPERVDLMLSHSGAAVTSVAWHPKRDDQLATLTDRHLRWAGRAAGRGRGGSS